MARRFSPAQMAYMKAKALHETVCEIEKQCKAKVLAANEFYTEPDTAEDKPERILDPIEDYRMNTQDFETYCKLCHTEYLNAGLEVKDWDSVARYPAWEALRKAETELINWSKSVIVSHGDFNKVKIVFDKAQEHKIRLKLIDLAMKLAT